MPYDYYICDVFTDTAFGGNPLAVLPDARGLSGAEMQRIAREFNFSESTFVLPAESGHDRRVRIFTPTVEVPFAGHPNIGTAFVLASIGELDGRDEVRFEETAGIVPVRIERRAGGIWCELTAPEPLTLSEPASPELLAGVLSLEPEDIVTDTHLPQAASVGLPFLMVELGDREVLARARIDHDALGILADQGLPPDIHLYTRSGDEFDVRARMFAPLDGVPEDPATGSANCALAALLSHYSAEPDGELRWRIAQGVEMGRPSVLEGRVQKAGGRVTAAHIGGASVMFASGRLETG